MKSAYTCQNELQQFLYKLMNKQQGNGGRNSNDNIFCGWWQMEKYSNKTQWWKKYTLGMTYIRKIQLRRREGWSHADGKMFSLFASKFLIKNEINFREKFSFHENTWISLVNPLSRVPGSIRRSEGIFSGISAQYLGNFMTWSCVFFSSSLGRKY